jgi:hypothetical protein
MTTRALREDDIPALEAMAAASPYPYLDLRSPHIEACIVVVDEQDKPLTAAAAERIPQLYLWSGELRPALKLQAIRLLHSAMATELRKLGYHQADAFIPPAIAQSFGRRMERTFRWLKNWPSWTVNF